MESTASAVNAALDKACPQKYPETLNESMRYSLLAGGKRVRPALCLAACSMVGGDVEKCMPTACAMEVRFLSQLLHAAHTRFFALLSQIAQLAWRQCA